MFGVLLLVQEFPKDNFLQSHMFLLYLYQFCYILFLLNLAIHFDQRIAELFFKLRSPCALCFQSNKGLYSLVNLPYLNSPLLSSLSIRLSIFLLTFSNLTFSFSPSRSNFLQLIFHSHSHQGFFLPPSPPPLSLSLMVVETVRSSWDDFVSVSFSMSLCIVGLGTGLLMLETKVFQPAKQIRTHAFARRLCNRRSQLVFWFFCIVQGTIPDLRWLI